MSLRRRALFALATSERFERAVRAVPGGEPRAWRSARRYVAGRTADDALAVAETLRARGFGTSLDLFGERVTDRARAAGVADAYAALAPRLPDGAWLSLDLSHVAFAPDLLDRVAAAVPPGARLQVGAEEAAVTGRVLDLALAAAASGRPVDVTLQANLPRSAAAADRVAGAGVGVRLVKGAYVEPGALPWGPPTDAAYAALARRLHAAGVPLALATHDGPLRAALLAELPGVGCEVLLGVRPADADALVAAGRPVRVYVPFGDDWFRYLMRRRAEAQGA